MGGAAAEGGGCGRGEASSLGLPSAQQAVLLMLEKLAVCIYL